MTAEERRSNALPVMGVRTYLNPSASADGTPPPTRPDPFVIRNLGQYYCFATGIDGISLSVSDDLVKWRQLPTPLSHEGRHNFWAPCVAQIDGVFHLYYSCRPLESDDPHDELLFVASSANIEGPYTNITPLSETFAIDPHVVRDADGQWYMFYSTNEPTGLDDEFAGTSVLVDRMLSPTRLERRPRPVVQPSVDEELFERNRFGGGRDWYTVEGGAYFTHGGRAYLTYSGNAYEREDYFIGYASAELTRPVGELEWIKHPSAFDPDALIRRSSQVEGTGHNSITTAPNLVDRWIVYHGRDAHVPIEAGTEQRIMRIDPLFFSGDRIVTPAPTLTTQDAPALPTVSSCFDSTVGWRVIEGDPSIGERRLSTRDHEQTFVVHEHVTSAYVAEVSVRGVRGHAGARFGVLPWFRSADDYVEAVYDAASQCVIIRRHRSGFITQLGSWPVASPIEGHWALFRLERTLDRVSIWLDDEAVASADVPAIPASVGLTSIRTNAEFSAFALTDHLELRGERLAALAEVASVERAVRVDEDGITSPSRRAVVLTRTDPTEASAITCEVEIVAAHGHTEIQPLYVDEENHVSVRIELSGYRITAVEAGRARVLAEGTSPHLRHVSVRTQRVGKRLIVHVDDAAHALQLDLAAPFWRAELVGARLRSYEETSYAPWRASTDGALSSAVSSIPSPRETLVKEQR